MILLPTNTESHPTLEPGTHLFDPLGGASSPFPAELLERLAPNASQGCNQAVLWVAQES